MTQRTGAARVHGRPVQGKRLAKVAQPVVVLIELLAARQGAPGYQRADVGPAGVVADFLAFDTRPGGRGDDLARPGRDVEAAALLVLARMGRVVVAAGG